MISFVWSPGNRLPAGTGGSENYTAGQVRELNRRGVPAQVVTVGLGDADGREEFDGVPFRSVATLADVGTLAGTVVFVNDIPPVTTLRQAFVILHSPPPIREQHHAFTKASTRDRVLIATSAYAARLWSRFLDVDIADVHVVHPFAEPAFAAHPRTPGSGRVLYAGRLSPEKGIYTLLSMLHLDVIADDPSLTFTVTTAGSDKPQGRIIERVVAAHTGVRLVDARRTPEEMSVLMAEYDVVVMPSTSQYWHETFGIVSVEAQHAGCRVVASDDGGLPETDCGALTLVAPDDVEALASGIRSALALAPQSDDERRTAAGRFTVAQSVDQLLRIVRPTGRVAAERHRTFGASTRVPLHRAPARENPLTVVNA